MNLIPLKNWRKELRNRCLLPYKGLDNRWVRAIRKKAKVCGENLYVGGKSYIGTNNYLGHDVSFNGMQIHGNGKVTIGNYFHSGVECIILTENHDY